MITNDISCTQNCPADGCKCAYGMTQPFKETQQQSLMMSQFLAQARVMLCTVRSFPEFHLLWPWSLLNHAGALHQILA